MSAEPEEEEPVYETAEPPVPSDEPIHPPQAQYQVPDTPDVSDSNLDNYLRCGINISVNTLSVNAPPILLISKLTNLSSYLYLFRPVLGSVQ